MWRCPSTTPSLRRLQQQRFTRRGSTARTVLAQGQDLRRHLATERFQPQARKEAGGHQLKLVEQAGQASREYRGRSRCQSASKTNFLSGLRLKEHPRQEEAQTRRRQL